MHIGIDLGVQKLNSNVFGKLQPQEKDYFINTTTQDFVKLALTDEKNTIFNAQTYADIREYYERLQVYIRSTQLGITEQLGYGYVYGELPQSITVEPISEGVLTHGVTYRVKIAGDTDLTSFGYTDPPVINETFVCDITPQTSGDINIVKGER